MWTVLAGVAAFTLVMTSLVSVLLLLRRWLLPAGPFSIVLRGPAERAFVAGGGMTLLGALADGSVFLPSTCGGQGTCGACRVRVLSGGGSLLRTEAAHITPREAREGWRLACQVAIRDDLEVAVPPELLSSRRWTCRVRSNRNVAAFIRELVLDLPPGDRMEFRAGEYVQIECPAHVLDFHDFQIEEAYRAEWDAYDLWQFKSVVDEPVVRAYSMANPPSEGDVIVLNVRIAFPPPGTTDIPPGKVSSYLFGLGRGDEVRVLGPFGEFHARDTDKEMVFIGGGAGMAPLRSIIRDELERVGSRRRMSFWYGARSLREAFYVEGFERLARSHENFSWTLALSEPKSEDAWTGKRGMIHQVAYDSHLRDHPAPEDIEYYLCGPPLMIGACRRMLDSLGVDPGNVLFDDFGG